MAGLHSRSSFANYLYFKNYEQRPMQCFNGHNVMQSETCCHRSNATNPSPHFTKYADHQGTFTTPAFLHSLILKTCYASDRTAPVNLLKNLLRFRSNGNTSKQRSTRHADKLAFQYAHATGTNIDIPYPITTLDDDGNQHDLTFEELEAFSRFPFSEGQLFLAMMTAEFKFSPRYAKLVRPKSSSALSDFTCSTKTSKSSTSPRTLARAPTRASTPFSTPQKKHKLDCDELDSL
jgi:hypothetical protein